MVEQPFDIRVIPTHYILDNASNLWTCQKSIGSGYTSEVFLEKLVQSQSGGSISSGPELCAVKRTVWNTKFFSREFAHQQITAWADFLRVCAPQHFLRKWFRPTMCTSLANLNKQQNPSHKHCFVELIGVSIDEKYSYIAEEYMMNGDLKGYMDFPWSEGDVKIVAQQLFEALKPMHDHRRLHLDLKPAVNLVFPFCII